MVTETFGFEDTKEIQAAIDFMGKQPYVDSRRIVLVVQSGGGLASLAYGSLGTSNLKGVLNFSGGLRWSMSTRWEFDMAEAFGTYGKTTKVESAWFYAKNDSLFPPDVVRMAHKEYQKKGGKATLFPLPTFGRDGHSVFGDPAGIPLWKEEVRAFLEQIGVMAKDEGQDPKRTILTMVPNDGEETR
jgi:dienelactone hydrolase